MTKATVKTPDRPSDDSASIAKVLTIAVASLTWISAPFSFWFVDRYRVVFDSFAVEPVGAAGIILDSGSISIALALGVLGTAPAVTYFATNAVKPKILVAGICGILASVLLMLMVSSFQAMLRSIGNG